MLNLFRKKQPGYFILRALSKNSLCCKGENATQSDLQKGQLIGSGGAG